LRLKWHLAGSSAIPPSRKLIKLDFRNGTRGCRSFSKILRRTNTPIVRGAATLALKPAGILFQKRCGSRKTLLSQALAQTGNPMPRVINVDKNRAYPAAVHDLKRDGTIRRRCRLRQWKWLNNIVEQDHRNVKRRTWLAKGYGSVPTAWRTLRGIEAMEMIRKGRARRVAKGDTVAQMKFVEKLFGIAA